MDIILDNNGVQTSKELFKLREESYKEMILICEMRIYQLQDFIFEESANSRLNAIFEKRIEIYKSIINRLSQRIITLKNQ